MTINPVDMQVLVPRAGEVERVNRTTQGQQQTDQQIMNQLLQENLKQKEQSVNELLPTEHNKIQDDEKKKNKDNAKGKKKKDRSSVSKKGEEKKTEDSKQTISNTSRYFDIKI
jgi:hypothetical protein